MEGVRLALHLRELGQKVSGSGGGSGEYYWSMVEETLTIYRKVKVQEGE